MYLAFNSTSSCQKLSLLFDGLVDEWVKTMGVLPVDEGIKVGLGLELEKCHNLR